MHTRWWLSIVLGACIVLPSEFSLAHASLFQVGEGPVRWDLAGYVRSFSVMAEPGLSLPGEETPVARHVDLLRLEHRLSLGERADLELHNRLAWTHGRTEALGVGVGVTPTPERSLSLEHVFIETSSTRLEHDMDRAVLRLWLDRVDIAIGRQAITWGSAVLFTSTDFWAPLSPFELDTSQKRGIDALRVLIPVSPTVELEAVVADRGSLESIAAGLKLHHFGSTVDSWVGLARLWEEFRLAGGARGEVGAWTLRAEGSLPVRLLEGEAVDSGQMGLRPPRITAGADRFGSDWVLMVEAHYNGQGATQPSDYLARTDDLDWQRGESFWLGRLYAGATVAWLPVPDWTLSTGSFVNLLDTSTLMTAQVQHDLAASVELSLGWYGGFGRSSRVDSGEGILDIGSEFGLYGHAAFLQLAAFF